MHQATDLREGPIGTMAVGDGARLRYARLTPRERELLELMAAGLTNEAIGKRLWLSPKTVESHVRSILGKLVGQSDPGCHRRVAAVLVHLQASSARPDDARAVLPHAA